MISRRQCRDCGRWRRKPWWAGNDSRRESSSKARRESMFVFILTHLPQESRPRYGGRRGCISWSGVLGVYTLREESRWPRNSLDALLRDPCPGEVTRKAACHSEGLAAPSWPASTSHRTPDTRRTRRILRAAVWRLGLNACARPTRSANGGEWFGRSGTDGGSCGSRDFPFSLDMEQFFPKSIPTRYADLTCSR